MHPYSYGSLTCDIFIVLSFFFLFFFFNDPATTEIYTLSLHDALPISRRSRDQYRRPLFRLHGRGRLQLQDRKSTRLNSSHPSISYAVFCLKKKKNNNISSPTAPTKSTGSLRMHTQYYLP